MKRFLIPCLVVAHVLLHADILGTSEHLPPGSYMSSMSWMLGPCQGALLALWIALGGGRSYLRVILAAAGVGTYFACFGPAVQYGWAVHWLALTTGDMAFVTAILLLARLTGLELTLPGSAPADRARFQFFLRDIFAWTTALAAVLSAMQFLRLRGWYQIQLPPRGYLAACACTSAVAVAFFWAVLGQRRIIARLLAVPAVVIAESVFLVATIPKVSLWQELFVGLGLMGIWLTASLLVVRWAGYRLSWQWRFSRKAVE